MSDLLKRLQAISPYRVDVSGAKGTTGTTEAPATGRSDASVSTAAKRPTTEDDGSSVNSDLLKRLQAMSPYKADTRKTRATTVGMGTSRLHSDPIKAQNGSATVTVPSGVTHTPSQIKSAVLNRNLGITQAPTIDTAIAGRRGEYQAEYEDIQNKLKAWNTTDPLDVEASNLRKSMLQTGETPEKLQARAKVLQEALSKSDTAYMLDIVGESRKNAAMENATSDIENMPEAAKNIGYLLHSYVGGVTDWGQGFVDAGNAVTNLLDSLDGDNDMMASPNYSPSAIVNRKQRTIKDDFEDITAAYGEQVSPAMEKWGGMAARGLGYSTPSMIASWLFPAGNAAGNGQSLLATLKNPKLWAGAAKEAAKNVVATTVKSPQFWLSAVPMYGGSYAEAKADGASEFEAQAFAILNGFAGAAVEVGGGVETIPNSSSGIRRWLKALLEEGREEVVQGIIEGLAQKVTYDEDKEWLSLTDPEAIVSGSRAVEEFASGAIIGGILGGGSTIIQSQSERAAYKAAGKNYLQESGGDMKSGIALALVETAPGTEAHTAAETMAHNYEKGKKPSMAAFGRLLLESQSEEAVAARTRYKDTMDSAKAVGVSEEIATTAATAAARFNRQIEFVTPEQLRIGQTDGQNAIVSLADGRQYVKADRQVITGTDAKRWAEQVRQYIDQNIRQGVDVVVYAADGDPLTITKDTSGKARFRNDIRLDDGTTRPMTDEEYAVKLRAETHIDELAEVSQRGKKTVPDTKSHPFAKDGFNYRTAYFLDHDGQYYRLTISVGKNGSVNTIYNVGKIKEAKYPLSGSKAAPKNGAMGSASSNTTVSQNSFGVNTHSMQEGAEYTQNGVAMGQHTADGRILLSSDISDEAALHFVLKHELAHSIEGTAAWDTILKMAKRQMGREAWEKKVADTARQRQELGDTVGAATPEREMVADWIGENLYSENFAQALARTDRQATGKFVQVMDKLRLALTGSGNRGAAARIATLERMYLRALETEQTAGEGQYAINPNFAKEYAAWDKKTVGGYFKIGTTSAALESVGINPSEIYWDKSKIKDILENPNHFMEGAITQVPYLLENPILIMQSQTRMNRVVVLGDVYDDHGVPVLCALELTPEGRIDNFIKVASAYGKDKGLQRLIDTSDILYIEPDKKRTDNWLQARRLQLPVGVTSYGSIGRVAQFNRNVKGEIEFGDNTKRKTPMQIAFEKAQAASTNTQSMQNVPENAQNVPEIPEGSYSFLPPELAAANERARQAETDRREQAAADADAIHRQAVERAVSGQMAIAPSQAQTMEELRQELGDEEFHHRLYIADQFGWLEGTVTVDGREVESKVYARAVEELLPDDVASLEQFIRDANVRAADEVRQAYEEGNLEHSTWLPINLQLFAAKCKLDWANISNGEDGKETRQFYEKRLQGMDENHHQELVDMLAGRSETYNPIGNEKTLARAKDKLRNSEWKEKLEKRLYNYRSGQPMLSAMEGAAVQVMINDALNDGEWERADGMIRMYARCGTDLGRAVQIMSLQRKLTPEGTIRAVTREFQKAADQKLGKHTNESLDSLAGDVTDAISRLKGSRVVGGQTETTASAEGTTPSPQSGDGAANPLTNEELEDALVRNIRQNGDPYITEKEVRDILHRAIENAGDIPAHLKKMLLKDETMADLAQRIAKVEANGDLNDATTRRAFEEALGLPTLSGEDVAQLTDLVNRMNGLEEGTLEHLEAMEDIYRFVGSRLPVSGLEAWQAWRKLAMLGNPKTHIRNISSNIAMFGGVHQIDSALAALMERAFIKDPAKRTVLLGWSRTGHGQRIEGTVDKATQRALVQMRRGGGKYDIAQSKLAGYKKYFGKSKVGETLNKASDFNSELLEKGDVFTFKRAFKQALGQIMTVRGMTEVSDEVYDLAYERAAEVTFRADNDLASWVNSLKRKGGFWGTAADIVIPFTKTPANIAKQMVQHSPVGVAKGAFDLVQSIRGANDAKTAAEAINELARGITGSALLAIGLLLGSMGLFNTKYGKTEKERAADELAGVQENALLLPGGWSITLDWLQPAAAPLVIGASIAQRLQEDGIGLETVFGAVMDGTDSLFELTMLQSLYDILGGYDAGVSSSVASALENAVSQSVPTLLGQAARSIDPVQRRPSGEGPIGGEFGQYVNQVLAKIPVLTYLLEPELDVWGEEVYRTGKADTGGSWLNFFQQLVLPANVKRATADDDITLMLLDLYENAEEKGSYAIPSAPSRDDATEMDMLYADMARQVGRAQRSAVEDLVDGNKRYTVQETTAAGRTRNVSKTWSQMTEPERLRVLNRIYGDVKENQKEPEDDYYVELLKGVQ